MTLTATLRQFCEVVFAVLAMTRGVTMRNISRWTSKGGSYRTIQRFYNTVIPWGPLCWVFFRTYLFDPESVYLLAGDESIAAKSGDKTHGLSRFFALTLGKTIPGLAFFALSLISVKARRSYPKKYFRKNLIRLLLTTSPNIWGLLGLFITLQIKSDPDKVAKVLVKKKHILSFQ